MNDLPFELIIFSKILTYLGESEAKSYAEPFIVKFSSVSFDIASSNCVL